MGHRDNEPQFIKMNKLFTTSLKNWYNEHKTHKREHRLVSFGEHTLEGKIYYRVFICWDCKYLFFLDNIILSD